MVLAEIREFASFREVDEIVEGILILEVSLDVEG